MKRILHIIRGYIWWKILCIKYAITYKKVVLVLVNENQLIDKNAVKYLDVFCDRKHVSKALILITKDIARDSVNIDRLSKDIQIKYISNKGLDLLYDYYSFDRFFDNIVFTYTTKPSENLLGRVLSETPVDEKDAVCLALYHLRYVAEVE